MGKFTNIAKMVFQEAIKPRSFIKGEDFENYLREYIFQYRDYELIAKAHGYNQNKNDYVSDSLLPDLHFADNSRKEFMVEAKFRSDYFKDKIEWCKPYQLKRYREIENDSGIPIFIAIGLDKPKYPDPLFVIPLKSIEYNVLFKSFLSRYKIEVDEPLKPNNLWNIK